MTGQPCNEERAGDASASPPEEDANPARRTVHYVTFGGRVGATPPPQPARSAREA